MLKSDGIIVVIHVVQRHHLTAELKVPMSFIHKHGS